MSLTCWLVLVHRISISTFSFVPAPCTEQVRHHSVCTWNTRLRQNFTHNYPSAQRGSPKAIPGSISINRFSFVPGPAQNRSGITVCVHGTHDCGKTSHICTKRFTKSNSRVDLYQHVFFCPRPCTEQVRHHNVCTWNTCPRTLHRTGQASQCVYMEHTTAAKLHT